MKEPKILYVVRGYENYTGVSDILSIFDAKEEAENFIKNNNFFWDNVCIKKFELNKQYDHGFSKY